MLNRCRNSNRRNYGSVLGAIIAAFLILTGMTSANAQPAEMSLDDDEISFAVETELLVDQAVQSHLIDVETTDGVVTLKGTVNNILAKDRAERLAERVKGVRSVINSLIVEPVYRTDEDIRSDVELALLVDPATESYDVDVTVSDGEVLLSGTVNSWQEKMLAERVVKSVKGVRAVDNEIAVDYAADRSDQEIRSDIRGRLEADVWIDEWLIDVNVDNGKVTLSGSVGSAAEKRYAEADAWVAGVTSVDVSDLEVEWWTRDEMKRKQKYQDVDDPQIRNAIVDALFYDPRVTSAGIDVRVENGVAKLSGEVDNLAAKKAAEEDAENTFGVWMVQNHIRVRPDEIAQNDDLQSDVLQALMRDPYVESFEIEPEVRTGLVYLEGTVNSDFERRHAEEVVENVKGVIEVVNLLDYRFEWVPMSDRRIKRNVAEQLYWSPFVDREQIDIETNNGIVTISGVVESWQERHAAEMNAFEAGAKDVVNQVLIEAHPYEELTPIRGER